MDANEALVDLMEVSSQVEAAVVAAPDGEVLGSTLSDEAARTLAAKAAALAAAAQGSGGRTLVQLEAATREGSLFVVRDGDRILAATTRGSSTAGLVFYDLKTCLRALAEGDARPKAARRRPRRKAAEGDSAAA